MAPVVGWWWESQWGSGTASIGIIDKMRGGGEIGVQAYLHKAVLDLRCINWCGHDRGNRDERGATYRP